MSKFKKLINKIARFIVDEVREKAGDLSDGLNWIVTFTDIKEKFGLELDELIYKEILHVLEQNVDEVADVVMNTYGFDVVIYGYLTEGLYD